MLLITDVPGRVYRIRVNSDGETVLDDDPQVVQHPDTMRLAGEVAELRKVIHNQEENMAGLKLRVSTLEEELEQYRAMIQANTDCLEAIRQIQVKHANVLLAQGMLVPPARGNILFPDSTSIGEDGPVDTGAVTLSRISPPEGVTTPPQNAVPRQEAGLPTEEDHGSIGVQQRTERTFNSVHKDDPMDSDVETHEKTKPATLEAVADLAESHDLASVTQGDADSIGESRKVSTEGHGRRTPTDGVMPARPVEIAIAEVESGHRNTVVLTPIVLDGEIPGEVGLEGAGAAVPPPGDSTASASQQTRWLSPPVAAPQVEIEDLSGQEDRCCCPHDRR